MAQVEIIKANLKTEDEIVNNLKKRVCAYARVSTDSEDNKQVIIYKLSIILK